MIGQDEKRALSVIISLLMAGNIYFIKRLVDGIYTMQQEVTSLHEEVSVLTERIKFVSNCNHTKKDNHMQWLVNLIGLVQLVPSFIQLLEQVISVVQSHPSGPAVAVEALKSPRCGDAGSCRRSRT